MTLAPAHLKPRSNCFRLQRVSWLLRQQRSVLKLQGSAAAKNMITTMTTTTTTHSEWKAPSASALLPLRETPLLSAKEIQSLLPAVAPGSGGGGGW